MIHSGFDVLYFFPIVTPHKEHADFNAVSLSSLGGPLHLFHGDTPLHRVQNTLATALRSYPNAITAHLRQGFQDIILHHPVSPRNGLKRKHEVATFEFASIVEQPSMIHGKDIIGIPHLVRIERFLYMSDFVHTIHITSPPMGIAKHRMRAPIALVRTPARGDEIHAAHTMVFPPYIHISLLIDLAAIRPGNAVQVRQHRAFGIGYDPPSFIPKDCS